MQSNWWHISREEFYKKYKNKYSSEKELELAYENYRFYQYQLVSNKILKRY